MTAIYRAHLSLPGVPSAIDAKAQNSIAVAAHLGAPIAGPANSAFIDGIQVALFAAAGTVLLAAVLVAMLLPRRSQ
jgi:hypothetical protein